MPSRGASGRVRSGYRERLRAGRASLRSKRSMSPETVREERAWSHAEGKEARKAEMDAFQKKALRSLQCGYCSQVFSAPDGDGTVTCTHCGLSSNREVNAKCGKCSKVFVGIAGTNCKCPYCKVENAIPEEVESLTALPVVRCGSCQKTFTVEQQGSSHQTHHVQCPFCSVTNAFKVAGAAVRTVKPAGATNQVPPLWKSKRETIELLKAGINADDACARPSHESDTADNSGRSGSAATGRFESGRHGSAGSSESKQTRAASCGAGKEEEMTGEERRRKEDEKREREERARRDGEKREGEERRRREEERQSTEERRRAADEKGRGGTSGARDRKSSRAGASTRDSAGSAAQAAAVAAAGYPVGKSGQESFEISAVDLELDDIRNKGTSLAERRRFFQQLCLQWHPDKNLDSREHSTRIFQHLQDRKDWFLS